MKTKTEPVFPQGLRIFKPNQGAPDWVIGDITINRDEMIDWLKNQKSTTRISIKNSKNNTWYLQVNEYEPKRQVEPDYDQDSGLPF